MTIISRLSKVTVSLSIIWAFLLSAVPVRSQIIVPGNIAGGSGRYVVVGLKKKGNYSTKRRSRAKRTAKQRSKTRRKVVTQSQSVARQNRGRRDIKEVTPEEYKRLEVRIKRMPREQASKVLAGAGEWYVTRNEVDNAVIYLEGAVELDENNKDAKLALSEVYTTLGDRALVRSDEFALLAANASAAKDLAGARKNNSLAAAEADKAERYYKAAISHDPGNSSGYVGLGQFYDAKDEDDKAKLNYEKALEIDSDLTEVKAPLGIIYFQEGEVAKAEEMIDAALAKDPDNAETQFFLGLIRYKQNRNEESAAALRRSVTIDDDNAESHYYLGAALDRLGKADEAISEYEKAVAIDDRFVNAWFDLGVAYFNKDDFKNAIRAFETAIDFNTDKTDELRRINDESYANLAEAYRRDGKLDLAISKYRIASARVTNDPELFTTFAFTLGERNLWDPAIRNFEKALSLRPGSGSHETNLGWGHYKASLYYSTVNMRQKQREHLEKAKETLKTAVAMGSESNETARLNLAATEFYLGIVLNDLGEFSEAARTLEKANDLSGEKWVAAVNELGIAYRKQGKLKQAIKQFRKAVDIESDYVFALFNLSEAEFQNGDTKEAKRIQAKLKRLDARLARRLDRVFFQGRGN